MNTTSIVGKWRTGSTETTTGNTTTTNTENALPLLLSVAPVAFERFSSDCAGTKPKVVCPCCTVCCGSSSSSSTVQVAIVMVMVEIVSVDPLATATAKRRKKLKRYSAQNSNNNQYPRLLQTY
jgi:hypothetical protein